MAVSSTSPSTTTRPPRWAAYVMPLGSGLGGTYADVCVVRARIPTVVGGTGAAGSAAIVCVCEAPTSAAAAALSSCAPVPCTSALYQMLVELVPDAMVAVDPPAVVQPLAVKNSPVPLVAKLTARLVATFTGRSC